jgi:hypothetical protein
VKQKKAAPAIDADAAFSIGASLLRSSLQIVPSTGTTVVTFQNRRDVLKITATTGRDVAPSTASC